MDQPALLLPDGSRLVLSGTLSVGRDEVNGLQLQASTVSRLHARLIEAGGRWFLEDLGSFNGTYVNGSRLQQAVRTPLRHADRIVFGSEALVFTSPAELADTQRTEPLEAQPAGAGVLSPFQVQVVECLCSSWLAGASLDELPSNEQIAVRLGTPNAVEAVKAALRRCYAKAGLTEMPSGAKRRALCRVARQRGWL